MRLAVLGTPKPMAVRLIKDVMQQMRPTHLVILLRTGLAKVAYDLAVEMGIPVTRHWVVRGTVPGGKRGRDGSWVPGGAGARHPLEEAVWHAAVVGKPDLVLCVSPDWRVRTAAKRHRVALRLFRGHGIRCVVGRFGNDRGVTWSAE